MHLFSEKKILANRNRAAVNFHKHAFILEHSAEQIINSLLDIEKNFEDILEIGGREGFLANRLLNLYPNSKILVTERSANMAQKISSPKLIAHDELLPFEAIKFDLILSCLNLHWINEPVEFLKSIINLLNPKGLFAASFIGGGSLQKLRNTITCYEAELNLPHYYHISPFIQFHQVNQLLQHAGFQEIIVDYEDIELEYDSALDLMKDIKNMGESNALNKGQPMALSRQLYSKLANQDQPFVDSIKIINILVSPTKNSIKTKLTPQK